MYIFFIALGILANFAFVPFAKPYMLFITLSLFFYYLLQAATFKRAFVIGFFFAISYFGFGSWWLFTIPKNTIATLFFGSAIIVLMAFYYALASTLSYFAKEKGFIFLTPLIFTTFEALRHSLWRVLLA